MLRNSRRHYDPASKRRRVEACLQPGVSLAGVALRHGVNPNLLRKWVAEQQRQRRNGVAEGAIARASANLPSRVRVSMSPYNVRALLGVRTRSARNAASIRQLEPIPQQYSYNSSATIISG